MYLKKLRTIPIVLIPFLLCFVFQISLMYASSTIKPHGALDQCLDIVVFIVTCLGILFGIITVVQLLK